MTSPTTLAHLLCGRSGIRRWSYIEYRIRRCTGLSPSRTSGRARETMTDIEYSRKDRSISSWISMGSMNPLRSPPPSPAAAPPPCPSVAGPSAGRRPLLRLSSSEGLDLGMCFVRGSSDVEEPHVLGVGLDEVAAEVDVLAHEHRADLVGDGRRLHRDLKERALGRVHRRLPQLVEV